MIKLTSTETHEYFAVPVPKDATLIEVENGIIFYETPESRIEKSIHIDRKYKNSELLEVVGQGSEISEDIAKEILGQDKCKAGLNDMFLLKFRLKDKGILVESPIKEPNRPTFINAFCGQDHEVNDQIRDDYEKELSDWQSYESKLVKAVILKVKK